jgi:peptide/nickel transport system ATP-binding protein
MRRVPDPYAKINGCPFHPRCDHAIPGTCNVQVPGLSMVDKGHSVRCFLFSDVVEETNVIK